MAYVGKGNHTILEAIPQPPPYFFNLTRKSGINVIGEAHYSPNTGSILHPLQQSRRMLPIRQHHHDFIIGFLLVLFIPIVSEIVQTILLRSRSDTINSSAFYTAYLVDEFSHMRNMWIHLTSSTPHRHARNIFRRTFRSKATKMSFIALFIATFVFFTDAATLQLSQKVRKHSSVSDFNLHAFQPIGTFRWRAKNIRRRSAYMPCISPYVPDPYQVRNFKLSTCIFTEDTIDLDQKQDISTDISIASWYHKGGHDHIISFANASIRISVRAHLIFSHTLWRILFHTYPTVFQDTQFIHNKTIHTAMQYACNKRFSQLTCPQMLHNLSVVSILQQNTTITLWQRNGTNITENVRGLVTTFNVRMNRPFYALRNSTHYLMASSAIRDTEGEGWYQHASTGREVHGIARLVSEDGRTAGLPIIFFCVVIGGVVLAALRLVLNPVSLARLAVSHMEKRERRTKRIRGKLKGRNLDLELSSDDETGDSLGRKAVVVGAGGPEWDQRNAGTCCEQRMVRVGKIAVGDGHSFERSCDIETRCR